MTLDIARLISAFYYSNYCRIITDLYTRAFFCGGKGIIDKAKSFWMTLDKLSAETIFNNNVNFITKSVWQYKKEHCKIEGKIQCDTHSKIQLAASHDIVKECTFHCNLKINSKQN